mgnify:CR=1 FL=1
MAAILDENKNVNLNTLADGVIKKLPTYARPYIVRILEKVDMTGTFKLKKMDLQKEGFDPRKIKNKLYYLNDGKYQELTSEVYDSILKGTVRF